jgi:hypothetical protein
VVTFAWVAGVIVVVLVLVALNDFGGGRLARRGLLRKPPQDPHEDARLKARGSRTPNDLGPGAGGQ